MYPFYTLIVLYSFEHIMSWSGVSISSHLHQMKTKSSHPVSIVNLLSIKNPLYPASRLCLYYYSDPGRTHCLMLLFQCWMERMVAAAGRGRCGGEGTGGRGHQKLPLQLHWFCR